MKIKCDKETIRKGFHVVENVISGSNVNPMLQNVRIVADDNTLELSILLTIKANASVTLFNGFTRTLDGP